MSGKLAILAKLEEYLTQEITRIEGTRKVNFMKTLAQIEDQGHFGMEDFIQVSEYLPNWCFGCRSHRTFLIKELRGGRFITEDTFYSVLKRGMEERYGDFI